MTTKKQGEIYLITNRINNKKYVGQALCITERGRIAGAEKRFKTHLNKALKNKNECPRLYTAIRKHGKDNFSMKILTKCDMDIIDSQEIHFIKLHNTINPNGYNLESGGKKNKKLNIDTRKLISDKHRFLQVSKENKSKILDVMKQLNISNIPMGIHYSNNTVTLYEGFTVHLNDIHMSFLSKGRTLVKKLQQALECYKILQEKDFEKLKKFKDDIHDKTNTLISHSRQKNINKEAREAMDKIGISTLPMYVRYELRSSRFYVNFPNKGCKYFKKNDPDVSLKEAIEYVNQQQRESVRGEVTPQ